MDKPRVRGIVIKNGKIVLIHRTKEKEDYYVFPGGGVESGESLESALIRESREEIGIDVRPQARVYTFIDNDGSKQEFYICSITGGAIGTGMGPEFTEYKNRGTYVPLQLPISDLRKFKVLPEEVRNRLHGDLLKYGNVDSIPYSEVRRE